MHEMGIKDLEIHVSAIIFICSCKLGISINTIKIISIIMLVANYILYQNINYKLARLVVVWFTIIHL